MEKFKDKYRIPSARAAWWDYKSAAAYFITICTHHRYPYFGRIENGKILLSEIGKIADSEWERTFEIRNDMNLTKGEYVIMNKRHQYQTHAVRLYENRSYSLIYKIKYRFIIFAYGFTHGHFAGFGRRIITSHLCMAANLFRFYMCS